MFNFETAFTQIIHDQEEARKEDEAEQAHSSLDSHEDWQHDQVKLISPTFIIILKSQFMILLLYFFVDICLFDSGTMQSAGIGVEPSLDFEVLFCLIQSRFLFLFFNI